MQSRFIFTFVLVGFWVGCGSGDLISGDDSSSTGDVVFADTNDGNDLSVSGDDGTGTRQEICSGQYAFRRGKNWLPRWLCSNYRERYTSSSHLEVRC